MSGDTMQRRGVISRAVSVLDAFRPGRPELTLNQIVTRTGLPQSTVHRMAAELVECGGLERVEGGGYRVGLRLWEIGSLATRATSLLDVVVPFMQDLYEVTHDNVQLGVLDGHDVLFVEKIWGARSAPSRTVRGGRLPLHTTAVGKVLLAHAPPALVGDVIAAGLPPHTPHSLTTGPRLLRNLESVRRTGTAEQVEEMDLGLCSVAAPVLDADGVVVAALGVVLRLSRTRLRQSTPAVRTAAASASRELREHGMRGAPDPHLLLRLAERPPAD